MISDSRRGRASRRFGRGARIAALASTAVVIALGAMAAQSAVAGKKPLAPPRTGTWKLIAASNTGDGLKVEGGVIGSFRVTRQMTIVGFHLSFTEEGESRFCAGGEDEYNPKSGRIKFEAGVSAPIIKANGEWLVALSSGSLGGGSLQGVEVGLQVPNGSGSGLIYITLASRKAKRSGNILWNSNGCNVAFAVKPG